MQVALIWTKTQTLLKEHTPDTLTVGGEDLDTRSSFFICYYHIFLGKHPWVLAAQASKFEGGWLHGEGA